jgi:hypothetical protein
MLKTPQPSFSNVSSADWELLRKHETRLAEALAADQARRASYDRCHRQGMTDAQYWHMLSAQHHRCALCGGPLDESARERSALVPVIDHDHASGCRRGIIHRRCNVGLGMFLDSIDVLKRAMEYLLSHTNGD